jgi:hypothetical protein
MHQLRLFEMRLGSPPSTAGNEATNEHVRLAARACAPRAVIGKPTAACSQAPAIGYRNREADRLA